MADNKSKIKEILTKEYEWESYVMVVLSLIAVILGILIFSNVLVVNDSVPLIADNPMAFAWVITIVVIVGLVIFAVKQFKKINL